MRNIVARWWTWDVPLSTGILLVAILGLAPMFGWALAGERWIILAALILVALVPIVIRWPVVSTFGLYAMLAYSFDALPLLQGSSLTKPVGVLTGGVLLVAGLMERRLGRPPSAALWWGLFMVWAAVSTAWALDPDAAFVRLKDALSLFVLYLVVVSFRPSRKELYWVCALSVLGGVLAAGAGYLFGFDEGAVGNKARGRIALGDQASNPNALGRVLILPLALAIAGIIGLRGSVQKAVAIGCVGLIGVGIYISMSRSGVAATIVVIAVLLYRLRARWQIIAAMIVLLVVASAMPDAFYQRIGSAITGEDSTGSGRTDIWEAGLKAALERFGVFGAGLENFKVVHALYVPAMRLPIGAHNLPLMVWVELGIIGLGLMFAAFGSHLLAVRRARRVGHRGIALAALEAGCFGVLTLSLFLDVIWTKSFWLAWALLTWAIYCEKQSDQISDAPGSPQ